jgi:integrase
VETIARRIKHFGGQHETLPIKDKKQIQDLFYYLLNKVEAAKTPIKKYQADRNHLLILIGLNTAFRAEDLLQLRVCDVIGGYISIKENKTGKMQNFRMNKYLHKDVKEYVERNQLKRYDYLFRGQKTKVGGKTYIYPINRQQGHRIVSRAGQAIGLNFVFGMHSLRKTFGYQYIAGGGNQLTLMKMYNHDSPDVTLRYVCWGREDAESDREAIYLGGVHKKGKK